MSEKVVTVIASIQSELSAARAAALVGELLQDSGQVTATVCSGYEEDIESKLAEHEAFRQRVVGALAETWRHAERRNYRQAMECVNYITGRLELGDACRDELREGVEK